MAIKRNFHPIFWHCADVAFVCVTNCSFKWSCGEQNFGQVVLIPRNLLSWFDDCEDFFSRGIIVENRRTDYVLKPERSLTSTNLHQRSFRKQAATVSFQGQALLRTSHVAFLSARFFQHIIGAWRNRNICIITSHNFLHRFRNVVRKMHRGALGSERYAVRLPWLVFFAPSGP